MGAWQYVIGIGLALLGLYTLWATRNQYRFIKAKGNKDTSPFVMWGMWSSSLIGFVLVMVGVTTFFGQW
ncbi:hypothetical protein [Schleiferilactobacillus perolens]|uniref:Immunity protein n=1 Tax=Schleiferilactobacillus perolens DSM 12744 TaxID=1423792 RepID=A0A0R1MT57_9LACO|nr:hypothetical protein [Schleiferilactobacillus perolens]KRL11351.1 hypothetical protein FD09_GL000720 [Schleiferilactobacillus perolens DSM 12744]